MYNPSPRCSETRFTCTREQLLHVDCAMVTALLHSQDGSAAKTTIPLRSCTPPEGRAIIDFRPLPGSSTSSLFHRSRRTLAQQAGGVVSVEDVPNADLSLIDTLPKLHALFSELLPLARSAPRAAVSEWNEWVFLIEWHTLDSAKKCSKLAEHFSYELFFFVKQTDTPFFDTHIRPYLSMRLPSERDTMALVLLDDTDGLHKLVSNMQHSTRLTNLERLLVAHALGWSNCLSSMAAAATTAAECHDGAQSEWCVHILYALHRAVDWFGGHLSANWLVCFRVGHVFAAVALANSC